MNELARDIRVVRWGRSGRLAITGMAAFYLQDTIKARCGRGSRWEYKSGEAFTITFVPQRKAEVIAHTLADDRTAT